VKDALSGKKPDVWVDLKFYPVDQGGPEREKSQGWECVCFEDIERTKPGHHGWPLLADKPMGAGETRRVGFVFLAGDSVAEEYRDVGKFYVWEGRVIGEADIVPSLKK
jgi:hypothetical protein